jgi:hypothetical protein
MEDMTMRSVFLLIAAAAVALPLASAARAEPAPRYAQQTPPAAPQQSDPAPAPAPKLTGADALKALIGNTVTGKVDDKEFTDFYLPDGTVKSVLDAQTVTGKWAQEGDKLCFTYPDEPRDCYAIEVSGDSVSFTDSTGSSVVRAQIQKGNARNL